MWQLKIRAKEKEGIFSSRAFKFKIKLYFYSQNYYIEKNDIFLIGSGIIEGEKSQINKFFRDLKKDKRITHLEIKNDYFTVSYCEPKHSERAKALEVVYNPKLIHLKPIIIDEEGWEEFEFATVDKKDLDAMIENAESLDNVESKVLYLKEDKIDNIMIFSMLPKLTDKQKTAILLAVKDGFYGYPRKTSLDKLAKKMGISVSTYQFHLAKAEAKLMPFVSKNL